MSKAHTPVVGKTSEIALFSGTIIDPLNPDPSLILIEDVAHSLAMQCRFTGHTRYHYSVAQHSVGCSFLAPKGWEFWALLHDAPETFMSDIARPIKRSSTEFGAVYRAIEDVLMDAVCKRFGLVMQDGGLPKQVGYVDELMLANEITTLMPPHPIYRGWEDYPKVPAKYLRRLTPEQAEADFMHRYYELGGKYAE